MLDITYMCRTICNERYVRKSSMFGEISGEGTVWSKDYVVDVESTIPMIMIVVCLE